jgi:serine/threonine protein kinase
VLSGGYYSYSADFFSFGVTLYVLLTRYYRMFGKTGDQFNRTIDYSVTNNPLYATFHIQSCDPTFMGCVDRQCRNVPLI